MVRDLIVLNSAFQGSRDLYWVDLRDPKIIGYNVYRAEDTSLTGWKKVNPYPVQGSRYRDSVRFTNVSYTFDLNRDWVEKGTFGSYRLRVKGATFWVARGKGVPSLAQSPDDVHLFINGTRVLPARVVGAEGEVWLPMGRSLTYNAEGKLVPLFSPDSLNEVRIVYRRLDNNVNLYLSTQTFYTIIPVLSDGTEAYTPGDSRSEVKGIMDVDSMDYMQREMVRRNAWLFEQVGEPAWMLIRKTKGDVCGCVNSETGEAKTECPVCFEVGIVGGFYGPWDFLFIDPDSGVTKTLEEGGIKVERQSRSYLGPSPIVKAGDLIVRRNGERLVIGEVTYKSPRGVLLQQEFDVHLIPPGSTRYLIPLDPEGSSGGEEIYNPGFSEPMANEGEPVSDPLTDPTKTWENPDRPLGRTTTFGRIMT